MKASPTGTIDPTIAPDIVADVSGPESRWVRGEQALLTAAPPDRWIAGHHLRGTVTMHRGQPGTPAPGAYIDGSLRATGSSRTLVEGRDFTLDPFWSAVGGASEPGTVLLDYGYRLLRIDSIVADESGKTRIVRGASRLTAPHPPELPDTLTRVANVFVPYDGLPGTAQVLPVGVRRPTPPSGRALPRFTAALDRGDARIAFWGDSVTAGGDAGPEEAAFPAVVRRALAGRFADARVVAEVVAHGGSTSRDWLAGGQDACDLRRLEDAAPDLVVVEFVNDAGLPAEEWRGWYDGIVRRAASLGADLVLTTPHWTLGQWMPEAVTDNEDRRGYTSFLRDYAAAARVGLADVSDAWRGLRGEGIPYATLLNNGINHPDERGHALAAGVIVDEIVAGVEAAR